MTEDEERVLSYVEHGIGGPNSIIKRLRPTFHDLIARGLIEEVKYYVLTSDGMAELASARK